MKLLKIKTLTGYHDNDEVMLHGMFQLLTDYVEIEADTTDWTDREDTRAVKAAMDKLYRWWTKERPKRKDPYGKIVIDWFGNRKSTPKEHAACVAAVKKQEEYDAEDQTMLHLLVDIRQYLWS